MLRSVKYGLYAAVLAGVVGGTVAWTSVDKTVHLLVDGRPQTIHTSAADVAEVLKAAGYHPGAHDLLAPSASSAVHDGGTIVFKRGRLLRLDVDGSDQYVWTTAPTVAQALSQLGFSTTDFTSVSRSRRLPLGATDISVRTAKDVTVVHDGRTTRVSTTDATVGQLLSDLNVTLGPDDRLSSALGDPLTDGAQLTVRRVEHKTLTQTRVLPFRTRTTSDPSLATGTTEVRAGHRGLQRIRWAAVYVDGKLVGKTRIDVTVVRTPLDRLNRVGTKQPVVAAAAPRSSTGRSGRPNSSPKPGSPSHVTGPPPSSGSPQSIARSMLQDYGWGQDQFSCLDNIWTRESGWRTNAANPSGAYGIPQALPGSKMASAGPNWQTNARTQIKWGLGYIASRYNSPCQAWSIWQSQGWY